MSVNNIPAYIQVFRAYQARPVNCTKGVVDLNNNYKPQEESQTPASLSLDQDFPVLPSGHFQTEMPLLQLKM